MECSGDGSWRVAIDDSAWPIHAALFVRDACRLASPHDPAVRPARTGKIADHLAALSAESRGSDSSTGQCSTRSSPSPISATPFERVTTTPRLGSPIAAASSEASNPG